MAVLLVEGSVLVIRPGIHHDLVGCEGDVSIRRDCPALLLFTYGGYHARAPAFYRRQELREPLRCEVTFFLPHEARDAMQSRHEFRNRGRALRDGPVQPPLVDGMLLTLLGPRRGIYLSAAAAAVPLTLA